MVVGGGYAGFYTAWTLEKSWERKIRVLAIWLTAAVFGRDIVSLAAVQEPRRAFVAGGEPPSRTVARRELVRSA